MTLPLPNFDDRRWADLAQEGQALIPFYAPDWTDHNLSDPGITLMELLAWVAEMDIFQLNQVPPAHRLKFLELINLLPLPPQPARTVASFELAGEGGPITLAAGIECEGLDADKHAVRFRTLDALAILPTHLEAVQLGDRRGWHDQTPRLRRGEPLALFGDDPQPGAAFYIGLKQSVTGTCLSLYFTVEDERVSEETRHALAEKEHARLIGCRPPQLPCGCDPAPLPPPLLPPLSSLAHYSARTVWEYLSRHNQWIPLDPGRGEIADDTRACTLNGGVRLCVPGEMQAVALGQVAAPLYYLRGRLLAGTYDCAPTLLNLALNAVAAEQAVTPVTATLQLPAFPDQPFEHLGTGTGLPWQQVRTGATAVVPSTLRVLVNESGEWLEWHARPDWDACRPADSHFVLDATAGTITFGDGERGRTVPDGADIAASYLSTSGEGGNLAAGVVTRLANTPHNRAALPELERTNRRLRVTNPIPATGGADAEALEHAEGRALELMHAPNRAVTLSDYEYLALRTPGARLQRVAARANLLLDFPCWRSPGIITLIIMPCLPLGRPMPSPELCRLVAAHLNDYRLVGSRIEVVGPEYVSVTVQARVKRRMGANSSELVRRIAGALNRFFDPLEGGPDGSGWPFGRDVFRAEVMQVVDGVEGVDHVVALQFIGADGQPTCSNVCLGPVGLVAAGAHLIEVE